MLDFNHESEHFVKVPDLFDRLLILLLQVLDFQGFTVILDVCYLTAPDVIWIIVIEILLGFLGCLCLLGCLY